jgi:hypothetical protein
MKTKAPASVPSLEERALTIASRAGGIRAVKDARTYVVEDEEHGESRTFTVTLSNQAQTCDCWEKSRSSAPCRHILAAVAFEASGGTPAG